MKNTFKPFIGDNQNIPELTIAPVLVGVFLGIIFGASSLYLALKVGSTVSASIPCAVLAITLFRAFSKMFGLRNTTILENNILQTTGSAGEALAFGVAATMPALLILGFDMDPWRTLTVALVGGLLGILMMIPLRKSLIVDEHGKLAYPEGTACADILIAGEKGGASAKMVFGGFFIGFFYKIVHLGMGFWKAVPVKIFSGLKGASLAADISPELLGVGYIIGPRVSSYMMAGGVIANFVLLPMIVLFGSQLSSPIYPGTKLIADMEIRELWRAYVLYIGAGAVAAGGIISMIRSLPSIVRGASSGLAGLFGTKTVQDTPTDQRTTKTLSMRFVLIGLVILVLAIVFSPKLGMNVFGSIIVVVFGFLFVTVSSRLVGEIGSSSNPVSGMIVATLILTCLIFLSLGWVSTPYRLMAMSIAGVVCVAAANAGGTSQDLKTGFLLGATPRSQQIALLIGTITSALVIGFTLNIINDAATIYSKKHFPTDVVIPDVSTLTDMEQAKGPDYGTDTKLYHVLHLPETPKTGPLSKLLPGKYLIDEGGRIQYFVDPGINGSLTARDDNTPVSKYEAPKARLMALIIDGILNQKLPWSLVLFGAFAAIAIELMGIPSLPIAVGIYLPISSSTPIFIGGLVRYAVDKIKMRKSASVADENPDASTGTLFSSGLIAGGSICGILLSFLSLSSTAMKRLDLHHLLPDAFTQSDLVAVVIFALLALFMVWIGVGGKNNLKS